MMFYFDTEILILSFFFFSRRVVHICQSILEFDGWLNIDLYHALDKNNPNVFTLRGNVTVSSINAGTFYLTQQHLSAIERNQIKELAEADKFYRLKAVVTHSHNGAKSTFLTSSKAVS